MRIYKLIIPVLIVIIVGCTPEKIHADLILTDGIIYTVDESFSVGEAIAVKDHKVLAVGSSKEIEKKYQSAQLKNLYYVIKFTSVYKKIVLQ